MADAGNTLLGDKMTESINEIKYVGIIVEIKAVSYKDRIPLNREKWKFVRLGYDEKGNKRWGVIIPPGKEKEFVALCGDTYLIPDELMKE